MKTLLTLILLISFNLASGQGMRAIETAYFDKGLKVQLENSLDLNKGYYVGNARKIIPGGNYTADFFPIMREGSNEKACTAIKLKSKVSGKTYYLIIHEPGIADDSYPANSFLQQTENMILDGNISRFLLAALIRFYQYEHQVNKGLVVPADTSILKR